MSALNPKSAIWTGHSDITRTFFTESAGQADTSRLYAPQNASEALLRVISSVGRAADS